MLTAIITIAIICLVACFLITLLGYFTGINGTLRAVLTLLIYFLAAVGILNQIPALLAPLAGGAMGGMIGAIISICIICLIAWFLISLIELLPFFAPGPAPAPGQPGPFMGGVNLKGILILVIYFLAAVGILYQLVPLLSPLLGYSGFGRLIR